MRNLNELDYFSLYLGGLDGGVSVAASAAKSGIERHLIEVLEDDAAFSVLMAVDQDGTSRNMVTTNNLGSRTFNTGDFVYSPHGGYIAAYTCDKDTQHYALPTSSRIKLESPTPPVEEALLNEDGVTLLNEDGVDLENE